MHASHFQRTPGPGLTVRVARPGRCAGGLARLLLAALALTVCGLALAHGDAAHPASGAAARPARGDAAPVTEHAFGRAGDPRRVSRTVRIEMRDTMRFVPEQVEVPVGSTVRFVIHNRGRQMHEMVLGTQEELQAHAELMKRFPDMEHADAHMAHVRPGRRGEIVWQFTQPGRYRFACLIPGHFEAGMVGQLVVRQRTAR